MLSVLSARDGHPNAVRISGDVELMTPLIVRALSELTGDVVVDASEVEFIDTTGYEVFRRAHKAAVSRGDSFVVIGLSLATRIAELLEAPYVAARCSQRNRVVALSR